MLAVGLVAAVALALWAAAPPFLDQVASAQLATSVRAADRQGDLILTSRPTSFDPAKVTGLDDYVTRSGAPMVLAGRVVSTIDLCPSADSAGHCVANGPRAFAARDGDLEVHDLAGRRPVAGQNEAAVARPLADQLGLHEGSALVLNPPVERPEAAVHLTVVGLFDPGTDAEPLWRDLPFRPGAAVLLPAPDLERLVVNPAGTFGAVVVSRFRVDPARIGPGNVRSGQARVLSLISRLPVDQDVAISTGVPDLLRTASDATRSLGGPIRTVLALCLLLLAAAATAVAALAVDARRDDIGLLKARGAGAGQVVAVFAVGLGAALAAAAALAPMFGALLASAAGWLPPLRPSSGGHAFPFRPTPRSLALAVPAAVLIGAAALVPFVRAARSTPVGVRRERARPARRSGLQQAGIDLAVVAGAAVLVLTLRSRGLVFSRPGSGSVAFDPLGVAAPAALLLAVGLLSLRVFAPAARGCAALSAKGRGVVMPLASWELGRDPMPRARLALLLVLAAGLGSYATVYDASLHRAAAERAAFRVGADARRDVVNGPLPGAVTTGVWRGPLVLGEGVAPVSTLGVDPSVFGRVLAWPTDGRDRSIISALRSSDRATAVDLPDGAQTLGLTVTAVYDPDPFLPAEPPGRVVLRVRTADGRPSYVPTSTFTDDGTPHAVTALLPPGSRHVDAMVLDPADGTALVGGFHATLSALTVDGAPAPGLDGGRWQPVSTQGRCRGRPYSQSLEGGDGSLTLRFTGFSFYDCAPVGLSAWADAPLPVAISSSLAAAQGWRVGAEVKLGIGAAGGPTAFQAKVVAVVDRFATLAPDDQLQLTSGQPAGFVVADLAGLERRWARTPGWSAIAADTSRPVPTEVWAAGRPQLPGATTGLLRRDAVQREIARSPLQQALQGATMAGVGVALVVALGALGAQMALSARRRRRQLGVLRSLGLDRSQLLGVLGVEYLLLAGLALLVAIPAGIVLLRVLLPFVDLGGDGRAVVPPTRMVVPGARLALLTGAVLFATALAVATALVVAVRARLHDVLRLGDD